MGPSFCCVGILAFGDGWTPVGPAVFKTVVRHLDGVVGGFDSHPSPPHHVGSMVLLCPSELPPLSDQRQDSNGA